MVVNLSRRKSIRSPNPIIRFESSIRTFLLIGFLAEVGFRIPFASSAALSLAIGGSAVALVVEKVLGEKYDLVRALRIQ